MRTPFSLIGLLIAIAAAACTETPSDRPVEAPVPAAREWVEPPRCYRTASSVLFGPRTATGQQGAGPGWIRLDGPAVFPDSTVALRDSAGGMLGNWRRTTGDSLDVVVFDDFLRVEMRLAVSDTLASGRATSHSDAALERDSTGQLADLRRSWTLSARAAPCDSMPG